MADVKNIMKYEGEWVELCEESEIFEGEAQTYTYKGYEIYLVRLASGIKAYYGRCPHAFGDLDPTDFDGELITCHHHLWQFDPETGESVNPTGSRLYSLELKINDGKILVKVPKMSVKEFREKHFSMYTREGE